MNSKRLVLVPDGKGGVTWSTSATPPASPRPAAEAVAAPEPVYVREPEPQCASVEPEPIDDGSYPPEFDVQGDEPEPTQPDQPEDDPAERLAMQQAYCTRAELIELGIPVPPWREDCETFGPGDATTPEPVVVTTRTDSTDQATVNWRLPFWHQLTSEEQADWMAESPDEAMAAIREAVAD